MTDISKDKSKQLFEKSKNYFPGGVNSPVRAFKSVGGNPLFIKKGDGPYIWDEDGNKFIDFCCSWGPLILGHNHSNVRESVIKALHNGSSFGAPTSLENDLAEIILSRIPFIDKLRFVSSGTEAVMSAIRLARGYTKKNKVLKFEGCYHGHVDSLLVKAGSGLATFGESSSAGVPDSFANETIVLPLNNSELLHETLKKHQQELACVIIEPIPANNGLLLQDLSFLKALRKWCSELNILLIFDEVISGFRVSFGGAAEYYQIEPDIVTYGKIIGGGLPVGAYAAKNEIMSHVSPEGPVYQAGTLSGNPVAMSAGIAQLSKCAEEGFYEDQQHRTLEFISSINSFCASKDYPIKIVSIGSIFWFSFAGNKSIKSADQINPEMNHFSRLYNLLLNKGVYIGPSGYEVGFVSFAHDVSVLKMASKLFCEAIDETFTNS